MDTRLGPPPKTRSGTRFWVIPFAIVLGLGAVAAVDALGGDVPAWAGGVVFVGFVIAGFVVLAAGRVQLERRLRSSGVRATATIVAARDRGARINKEPVVELTLRVEGEGIESYTVRHDVTVSAIESARFQPHRTLDVVVDRTDRTLLLIQR